VANLYLAKNPYYGSPGAASSPLAAALTQTLFDAVHSSSGEQAQIYAGLRRQELLWLTFDDLDLETGPHGIIRVRAKTIDGESWQPKTKVNRAVPISSTLRRYFDQYRRRITPGGWLFPSPDGKRWDSDNFSSDLRSANAANAPLILKRQYSSGSRMVVTERSCSVIIQSFVPVRVT
jgi:integrase